MEKAASVERLATGIPGMDEVLGGGIPFGTNVLLLGEPGTGKSTFCSQMVRDGLDEGLSCLFITTAQPPKEMMAMMESLELDVKRYVESNRLVFIDCYSSRLGILEDTFKVVDLSNLNAFSLEIERSINSLKKPIIFVFDSFSDVVLAVGSERALKFLSVISARVRKANSIGVFTFVEKMHDNKTKTSIEFLCDGVVEMEVVEEKRLIMVKKMRLTSHPLGTFEFTIKIKKGIVLRELEEFFEH